jgi:hypothetical protein
MDPIWWEGCMHDREETAYLVKIVNISKVYMEIITQRSQVILGTQVEVTWAWLDGQRSDPITNSSLLTILMPDIQLMQDACILINCIHISFSKHVHACKTFTKQ